MTLSTGKTTARPWRVTKGRAATICNDVGVKIASATMHAGGDNWRPREDAAANAALIVRAVNAHEAAIGLLGSAAEELSHLAGLLDDAQGQDAVKLCGKIQHFLVAIR